MDGKVPKTTPAEEVVTLRCLLGDDTPSYSHDLNVRYGYTLGNSAGFEIVLSGDVQDKLVSASCVADAVYMDLFISRNDGSPMAGAGAGAGAGGKSVARETYLELSSWKGSPEFNRMWSQSITLDFSEPLTASELAKHMRINGSFPSVESVDMLTKLEPDIGEFPMGNRGLLTMSANGHKLLKQVLKKVKVFDSMVDAKAARGETGQLQFPFIHRVHQWSANQSPDGRTMVMASFPANQPMVHSLKVTLNNVSLKTAESLEKACITLGTNVASMGLECTVVPHATAGRADVVVNMPAWTPSSPLVCVLGGNANIAFMFRHKPSEPLCITMEGKALSLSAQALKIIQGIRYFLQPIAETEEHVVILVYLQSCVGILKRPKTVDGEQRALETLTGVECASVSTA